MLKRVSYQQRVSRNPLAEPSAEGLGNKIFTPLIIAEGSDNCRRFHPKDVLERVTNLKLWGIMLIAKGSIHWMEFSAIIRTLCNPVYHGRELGKFLAEGQRSVIIPTLVYSSGERADQLHIPCV